VSLAATPALLGSNADNFYDQLGRVLVLWWGPVFTQTNLNVNTQQCINEGNLRSDTHWVWSHYGNPANFNSNKDPHVLYTY